MDVYGEAISGSSGGVQVTQESYIQKLGAATAGMGTGKYNNSNLWVFNSDEHGLIPAKNQEPSFSSVA